MNLCFHFNSYTTYSAWKNDAQFNTDRCRYSVGSLTTAAAGREPYLTDQSNNDQWANEVRIMQISADLFTEWNHYRNVDNT